jgi:hypothetical protein
MLDEKLEELHLLHFKPSESIFVITADYEKQKSRSKILFKDIISFQFGPNSTTFWMMRKHII